MKVLIDTNIILDYLTKRTPFYDPAYDLMEMCRSGEVAGYIAAHSVMNCFYILRKEYTEEERREILIRFLKLVSVVGIDRSKISSALRRKEFSDMEDCLQDECADTCGAEYIITRNIKDFDQSTVKAILPEDFVKMMKKQKP